MGEPGAVTVAGVTVGMGGVLRIEPASAQPPFEQVRSQLAAAVDDGRLVAGTRLPPIRALAGELGLAANTVARAYRELEEAGLVVTRRRLGTVVSPDAASAGGGSGRGPGGDAGGGGSAAGGARGGADAPPAGVRLAAADYARAARSAGVSEADAVALVRQAYRRRP